MEQDKTPEKNLSSREKNLESRSLFRFPSSFSQLWSEMEDKMSQWMAGNNEGGVDVSEDEESVYVKANLPGVKREDIDVSLHQNTLWIKGERKEENKKGTTYYRRAKNSFFYQITLPEIEENTERAEYENGVLELTFKKNRAHKPRKITINNING